MSSSSAPITNNQVEHEHIRSSLQVEKLEANLFRSKMLWLPGGSKGVFGGQVISQALVSATQCVDKTYGLHSMHCYFLLGASPDTPVVYHVEVLRRGKSYLTCMVKAIQHGNNIFILLCSFHKSEPWQITRQWQMPIVPTPEQCADVEDVHLRNSETPGLNPTIKQILQRVAEERRKSPVAMKQCLDHEITADGHVRYMYWMKARDIRKYPAHYQKCILAYISDLYLIATVPKMLNLDLHAKGPGALGMTSTLDHVIQFYDNDFDCGDWMLYVMENPVDGLGRGLARGQIFTREGKLIAITTQEGVVREDVRPTTRL
ncbi:Thioesterase/thiol ester dehydrase-isomerase [Cylindrobasidium torrendii FP15055 ss-10]|uniref:Thioesterase/thiol ester dehydrase-isomerase n=1 Tax=Cylindrobasidium torrendii FP15055 ss-10 TaxID=1314674 RepID=A0A0D7BGM2_9AGAR|nr:Thioesterase/thiol ester dehydrase-isomerase [Cylindrobasidium torrendii FP15055 ss-10]